MQVGDLVQWTGRGEEEGWLGVIIGTDEMGFAVHWLDGMEEWYEEWDSLCKYVRKIC